MSPSESTPKASSYAYRPACQQCHERKIKCDAILGRPCSACRSADVDCVARARRRRNCGPARTRSVAHIAPAETTLGLQIYKSHGSNEAHGPPDQASPAFDQPVDSPYVLDDQDEIGQAAAALSSLQDAGDSGARRHLVEMLSQDDLDIRIIQKGVRIVYAGQEFSNINYLIRHRAQNEAVHHFPANQISRKYLSMDDRQNIPKDAFTLPAPKIVDDLLDAYFRHVNPFCPILDETIFMAQYRGRDPANPPPLLVLHAVLMVGAHVLPNRPDRQELKTAFFRRAKMLFDARFEWNRDVVVQAALLLTWSSEGVEDVGANSYHWVGIAVRMALGLGMHRDASASTLIAHDKRLWKRLWWILVQFDVHVTLWYGRPQAIDLNDSDVPPLTQADFKDDEHVEADLVIQQSAVCTIMSEVLRERFGLRVPAQKRTAALLQADQNLAQWITSLPECLQTDVTGASDMSTQTALLQITYYNFLILLHRPPPKLGVAAALSPDDMEICSSAASNIVNLLQSICRNNELQYLNVFAVNVVFTTMIQLSAEMRTANPILAANAMRKFETALEILRSLSDHWFNAEILLHLFEDSSEVLKQQLSIGKSTINYTNVTTGPCDNDPGISLPMPGDDTSWHTILPDTAMPAINQNVGSIDTLGWNHMYWGNTGFPYLSPFEDAQLSSYDQ